MEEPANEEPVLEQKNPELAAPNLAVPTAGQLETTTPAPDAPIEPPVMPPTKEQAARVAAAGHLQLAASDISDICSPRSPSPAAPLVLVGGLL